MKLKIITAHNKYNNRKNNHLRAEKIMIFAISATIALPMVDTLINVIANVQFWDSLFTLGVYYISLLLAIYYAFKRLKIKMLLIPALFIGLGIFSFIMFPDNRSLLIDQFFFPFFTASLPLFIITLVITDYSRLFKALRIASIASIISALIFVILQFNGKYEINYMSFSYGVTLPVMLMLIFSFQNKNKFDYLMAILGFVIVFLVGARGPLVGLLIGSFFYFLIHLKLNLKNIILLSFLSVLIFFFLTNFDSSINFINDFLLERNISSRTVQLLLNDTIEQTSGRDILYNNAILSAQNFFMGNGMIGDRVILGGAYAHNLFLELLLEYGIILGTLFTIILIYYLLRSLFVKNKGILYYLFFAIFFTTGFVKLQFSFSYTLEPTFFMMLALVIRLMNVNSSTPKIKEKYASQYV